MELETEDSSMTRMDTMMNQKKRRSMSIIKVALFMLRRKSTNKSTHADVASKGMWRRLLGSMRPLHLENNKDSSAIHLTTITTATVVPEEEPQQPPPPPPLPTSLVISVQKFDEDVEKTFVALAKSEGVGNNDIMSPLPNDYQSSPSCASSSSYDESRYASAMNLNELDVCDEEDDDDDDDEDCQFDDSAGDSMIDLKAEMFIAQFYEQMRQQNSQATTYQMIRG